MSGKIGYVSLRGIQSALKSLNPFYVREDWLRSSKWRKNIESVLIPFMSGKIGYRTRRRTAPKVGRLNPFYVREDWLRGRRFMARYRCKS